MQAFVASKTVLPIYLCAYFRKMEDDDASQQDADEVIRLSQQPPVVGLLMAQAKATLPPVSLIASSEKEWLRAALTRQRKMIRTKFHCRAQSAG